MFAVKGVYDGNSVIVEEPIPVKERYEVIVTFIDSISYDENTKYNNSERKKAFDFLINFPKKELPKDFNYKRELANSASVAKTQPSFSSCGRVSTYTVFFDVCIVVV